MKDLFGNSRQCGGINTQNIPFEMVISEKYNTTLKGLKHATVCQIVNFEYEMSSLNYTNLNLLVILQTGILIFTLRHVFISFN